MEKSLLLVEILETVTLVNQRFRRIKNPSDFVSSPKHLEKMDSIAVRLLYLGECVKKLESRYPQTFLSVGLDP